MILERFAYSPYGTFGRLIVGDLKLWTVEQPWNDNLPKRSCVPEGVYTLEHHEGSKYKDTWALVGETVSHWPGEGKKRATCVFHKGNTAGNVWGCIAPGMTLSEDSWAVSHSNDAMAAFRKEMYATQTRTLSITQYRPVESMYV